LPVHAPTTFSHSVNLQLSPSIIPLSFTPGLRPTTFTNLSHHRLPYGLRTDFTDFSSGPFLLSILVFVFSFFIIVFLGMLSDHCLSCPMCLSVCLSVTLVLLWPNGWMDQDDTWHAGRPQPWSRCIRWEHSSPSPKGAQPPNFRPICVVAKWLDGSRCHLVGR